MKKITPIILLLIFSLKNAQACQGAFDGVITVNMIENLDICVSVELKDYPLQKKCFAKGSDKHQELLEKIKGLQPGKTITISSNDNQNIIDC